MNRQANLTIEDITIKNMWGTTSGKGDPQAGTLVCSAEDVCFFLPHLFTHVYLIVRKQY